MSSNQIYLKQLCGIVKNHNEILFGFDEQLNDSNLSIEKKLSLYEEILSNLNRDLVNILDCTNKSNDFLIKECESCSKIQDQSQINQSSDFDYFKQILSFLKEKNNQDIKILSCFNQSLNLKNSSIHFLKLENEEFIMSISSKNKKIDFLLDEITILKIKANEDIISLGDEKFSVFDIINEKNKYIENLNNEIDSYKEDFSTYSEQIIELNEIINGKNELIYHLQDKINFIDCKNKDDLDTCRVEISRLNNLVTNQKEQISSLCDEKDLLNQDITTFRVKNSMLEGSVEEKYNTIKNLEKEISVLKSIIDGQNKTIDNLKG